MKKKVAPVRGTRIQFVKGSYKGKKGWLNKAMDGTKTFAYIILDAGQSPLEDADYATRVKLTSIAAYLGVATSPEEFVVQEDPKVAYHFAELAVAVAEVGFTKTTNDLLVLIKICMDETCITQAAKNDHIPDA